MGEIGIGVLNSVNCGNTMDVEETRVADKNKVLIVDDDLVWQSYLTAGLSDTFDVRTLADGLTVNEVAAEWRPDAIMLDIEMPVRNGYQVCQLLKEDAALAAIPVIFLSGKNSLHEKITGFEVGGEDYLVKPCEYELLKAKIGRAIEQYHEKRMLDEKANAAQGVAFEALSSSADLGRSLRFAERTYTMNSYQKLAEGLFQTMDEFGLQTSLMLVTSTEKLFFSHNTSEISPLERDMFLAVHEEGRFCDFGNRTFCNFKLASLLIKNMPLDHPDRYGRIKDTVPWIMGAVDGKVGVLDKQDELLQDASALRETLLHIADDFSGQIKALHDCHKNIEEMIDSIISPGADFAYLKAELSACATHTDAQHTTMTMLRDLVTKHQGIIEKLTATNDKQELGSDEIFSSDIDLF